VKVSYKKISTLVDFSLENMLQLHIYNLNIMFKSFPTVWLLQLCRFMAAL